MLERKALYVQSFLIPKKTTRRYLTIPTCLLFLWIFLVMTDARFHSDNLLLKKLLLNEYDFQNYHTDTLNIDISYDI